MSLGKSEPYFGPMFGLNAGSTWHGGIFILSQEVVELHGLHGGSKKVALTSMKKTDEYTAAKQFEATVV